MHITRARRPWVFGWAAVLLFVLGAVFLPAAGGKGWAKAEPSPSDDAIALAVTTRLRTAPAVPFDRLDVRTTDGIVEISGTASHLLAAERAVSLAQSVKGVRAVVDRISVEPSRPVADEQLVTRVTDALARDPAADAYQITVTVRDGVVRLAGRVDSWAERRLAEDVVKSVAGVRAVENRLVLATRLDRPDAEIRADVLRRLRSDVWVDADRITVRVDDAVVHLSGTVPSAGQGERARALAWVFGVTEVRGDDLTVRWSQDEELHRSPQSVTVTAVSDQAIEEAVRDALRHDPRVANFNLGLTVNDGRVMLTGVVDNLEAKRAAARDAHNTVGVWSVKNLLKVRPVERYADETIANDVRAALLHDPALQRSSIEAHVIDGTVHLSGQVDSLLEKRRADQAAARVKGVVAVVNDLTVRTWPWSRDDDLALQQQIREQLWWSPFVDSDDIRVTVDDGVATLSGTVGTWHERRMAEENAREGGATIIRNQLNVAGSPREGKNSSHGTKETSS